MRRIRGLLRRAEQAARKTQRSRTNQLLPAAAQVVADDIAGVDAGDDVGAGKVDAEDAGFVEGVEMVKLGDSVFDAVDLDGAGDGVGVEDMARVGESFENHEGDAGVMADRAPENGGLLVEGSEIGGPALDFDVWRDFEKLALVKADELELEMGKSAGSGDNPIPAVEFDGIGAGKKDHDTEIAREGERLGDRSDEGGLDEIAPDAESADFPGEGG